jgi:hypothetical protein
LLNFAEPRGNSIRLNDPDRTDAVDLGNETICLGITGAARTGRAFGTTWDALGLLTSTLLGIGGGRMADLAGAGGGGATLRAIFCFVFGAVEAGGSGGGSGALGGVGTTLTAGAFAIFRRFAGAILGGGGGAMAVGVLRILGGGGDASLRGAFVTGGSFLVGVRRTTLFLVVRFVRLMAFLVGLRLARRFTVVGGVRTSRLFPNRFLDFETIGNFAPLRYGLLR